MLVIANMSYRNIRKLPLLEAFHAIMTRGSLVAAAESMGVTQSAVSKQLAQLRDWLDDDLFVRTSDGMQPTPRALDLRERVEAILSEAADIAAEGPVSPADFNGRFVLRATDEILERLVPFLIDRIAEEAPRMRLVTRPLASDYSVRQLEDGQANLVVAVNWHAPELLKQRRIFSEHFVCVMHKKHALARVNLTLKRYAEATHVLVAPLGHDTGVVDFELERLGLERHVCASIPAFSLISEAVLGHTRVTTLPSRVAEQVVQSGPFVTKPLPLAVPPFNYFALWHPRFSAEPRLRWVLAEVVRALT